MLRDESGSVYRLGAAFFSVRIGFSFLLFFFIISFYLFDKFWIFAFRFGGDFRGFAQNESFWCKSLWPSIVIAKSLSCVLSMSTISRIPPSTLLRGSTASAST